MKDKSGQVLLITVMLLATAITVILSVSFTSKTETQITKLEEDAQKALAAAEAGIEAALSPDTNIDLNNLNFGANVTTSTQYDDTKKNIFVSPLLQKDEQYTFYLSKPGGTDRRQLDFNSLTTDYAGELTICFGSPNAITAIEITLIERNISGNYSIERHAVNPATPAPPVSTIIENAETASALVNDCPANDIPFQSSYTLDVGNNSLFMAIRPLGNNAKIGIKGAGTSLLPLQGITITSTASVSNASTKVVKLFQSYPQIPTEFFVVRF